VELGDLGLVNQQILVLEATAYYEHILRDRPDELGQWTRDRMLGGYANSPTAFVQLQQSRAVLRRQIDEKLASADVLLLPGMPFEAPPLGVSRTNTRFTGPFNALGWPAVVVPTGTGEHGLPVSMQIVGRPWAEKTLFAAARVVERDGPWGGGKRPPVR
jgi:Asp-tRNA(Asn)/Glu-tRNA(Gln) amidotransferase A subunit family amidase